MNTSGLSLEQAPPLSVPSAFFLTAPVAIVAAGVFLLVNGGATLDSMWSPLNAAAAHLLTVGFLLAVMMGALYQMVPVVAGIAVPAVRLAHLVHAGLVVGGSVLIWAQATANRLAFAISLSVLGLSLLLFLLPVAIALLRTPMKSDTVSGLRLAVGSLGLLAFIGVVMALRRAGGVYGGDWVSLRTTHVSIGFISWVGGLIAAVSWQVVPMFYLASEMPRWSRLCSLLLLASSTVAAVAVWFFGGNAIQVVYVSIGGGAAVWLLHPITVWRAISQRRRRRKDPSLALWRLGLLCAPVAFATGLAAALTDGGNWPVLFGWLVLWGWAGAIMHGMLSRIVPFLVWFHRFSSLIGLVPVPAMRQLLPVRRIRVGFVLHALTLLLGCAAILLGGQLLARAAGAGVLMTGLVLGANLVKVMSHPRPTAPTPTTSVSAMAATGTPESAAANPG